MSYMPILKGKAAEFRALGDLAPDVKHMLSPLIELVVPEEEEGIDEYLDKIDSHLERNWANGGSIYVDASALAALPDSRGQSAMEAFFAGTYRELVTPIPVTGLGRSDDSQEIVREAAQHYGACVRLANQDFEDPAGLALLLGDLLERLALQPASVDLLLDLGDLPSHHVTPLALAITGIIESVPNLDAWRSVKLAGTGFPRDLGGIGRDTITRIPRTEWRLWNSVRNRGLGRCPDFSDYAIAHPELVDFKPGIMDVSAALRYTIDSDWLVIKGRGIRRSEEGAAQMHALCRQLVGMPEFSGADYSEGDRWISDCSRRAVSYGNPERWRRVGTVHHLTFVVRQLANLPAP